MLAIRMQRTGRRGHAMFRVIVQDARRTPTSGKVVARLGSYDPHAKTVVLDKEKAAFYLEHGAQPSERVIRLLQGEGVKLPAWATPATKKESAVRNPDKRRSTRPDEPEAPTAEPAPEAEAIADETSETPEAPAEETATTSSEDTDSTEEKAAEAPAEAPEPADQETSQKPAEPAETEASPEPVEEAPGDKPADSDDIDKA